MSNFKVGQKVVCVERPPRDNFDEFYGLVDPLLNDIYTIRELDGIYIRLEEIKNPLLQYSDGVNECAFKASYFRPLDHAFADEVEAMIKEQIKQDELINI